MTQSVIPKKKEKIEYLLKKYGSDITIEEFKIDFKKEYPKDWQNIKRKYNKQVVIPKKKGKKAGPMPNPEQYLTNMYKVNFSTHNIDNKKHPH